MGNEITAIKPTINISGNEVTDLACLRVTKKVGVTPSTADLQYIGRFESGHQGPQGTGIGPTTLTNGGSYEHKQRVMIYNYSTSSIFFQGWLTKRQDQHMQNTVLWTASDDTILLRNVYVRGAYVLDTLLNGTNELKYSSALYTVFNPKGAWNCTGVSIGGDVYPVFTPTAVYGKAYETPNTTYSGNPSTDGSHQPWTPRRILKYLQLVMHAYEITSGVDGETDHGTCSLDTDYLYLDYDHITGLDGKDPAISNQDPLDRISYELSLQGDTLIGAFAKTLEQAGTHQLATRYDSSVFSPPSTPPAGKTLLIFKPSGYLGSGDWKNIDIQFDSLVDESTGRIFDFSLSEDSIGTSRKVYCEGETEYLETRLVYEGVSGTDTIVPAWTSDQEEAFFACIYGDFDYTSNDPGAWALVPKVSGKESYTAADFWESDGTNETEPAKPFTKEALAIAQESFPHVFRAFHIKTQGDLATGLSGPQGYQGTLIHPRPILPTQLQFFTWKSSDIGDVRLRTSLPIRVSIKYSDDTPYFDVPRDVAIRVTTDYQGNNLLWLDGVSTAADGTIECIYSGSALNAADINDERVTLRKFRINCAMPRDTRTMGHRLIGPQSGLTGSQGVVQSGISTDYDAAFVGGDNVSMRYLDKPNSFRSYYQYNSYPGANTKYYGGTDGTTELTTPLTRYVPPGDEAIHAEYAATREMMRTRRPVRNSSWQQAGIYTVVDSGDWIGYVYVNKQPSTEEYLVNSVANTVVFDFLNQQTIIGDTFGEY